ncbi:MAG: adenylate/guanylate cyclase domain-containing protein [Rubrobacter sp.]|nr:adenylate/guanylate cyclase domain-containing protein [Rubrobacter sp.]
MRYPEFYYRWEWQLRSAPEQLWPLVGDTNRFNRDTGLPPVSHTDGETRHNARQNLYFSRFGIRVEWEEEPFEWVRPHRFGVHRRYHAGPVASTRVLVELKPQPEGGTQLVYRTWIRPSNLLGMVTVPPLMKLYNHRAFAATFRKCDELAMETEQPPEGLPDVPLRPGEGITLAGGGRARLAALQRELIERTGESELVPRLIEVVENGNDFAMARLRPYALADTWGVPRQKVLEMCLYATRVGIFDLRWHLLCPLCRGGKESSSTLAEMKQQAHCETCNIDFAVNFDRSVELTFRLNPAVRQVEDRNFCVGGPQVTPHIMAQQLLAAGFQRSITIPLEAGRYRLRTLNLSGGRFLAASADGRQEATLTAANRDWPRDELVVSLTPTLRFENATDDEQLFILERMAWSDQAATAAEVTTLQVFRDLFSNELLRPGEQISVGSLTILFTDLRDSTSFYRKIGDAPAFGRVLDHFGVLREAIAEEDGALVKTIGDAVMAVFRRPISALRAILSAQQQLASPTPGASPFHLKAGIHHGPCIAVTMNERLDYFGSVVNIAARLERLSSGTDVIISDAIRYDPEVTELLSKPDSQLAAERFEAKLKGFDEEQFYLWRIAHALQ